MKVIGQAGGGQYLVMVSGSVLRDLGGKVWKHEIHVGDTLDVRAMVRRLNDMDQGWDEAKRAASALKAFGELLEREIPKPEQEKQAPITP